MSTADKQQAAKAPIDSLISKSEKALLKLKAESWQAKMLQANLKALHYASARLNQQPIEALAADERTEALKAFSQMIEKTEKAQLKFTPGSAQHSLLQNRLQALQTALSQLKQESAEQA